MKAVSIGILLACAAFAQTATLDADKPVDAVATLAPESVAPGGQGQFKITLRIMEGGHANSNVTSDPNLIPTSFTPKPAPGITWGRPLYPESKTVTEWYAADPLPVFLDNSVIAVPFTVEKNASASTRQMRPGGSGQVEGAEQMDAEHLLPLLVRKISKRHERRNSGIVQHAI